MAHPNGKLKARIYFGSGSQLTLNSTVNRGPGYSSVDLSIIVKERPGNGWIALYHHSPLSTFTLNGGVYPIAVVVYVNATGDEGYTGKALYWWNKILRVKDASYYESVMKMASDMAKQWNASFKVLGNDTIAVEAKLLQLLKSVNQQASWWYITIHNVTETSGAVIVTNGYGAVSVNGQLYLVDPGLLTGSPIELTYITNGSLAILKELTVRSTKQSSLTSSISLTLIDPPLIPDVLLYTFNITGIAVSGPYLLKLSSITIQKAPSSPAGSTEIAQPNQLTSAKTPAGATESKEPGLSTELNTAALLTIITLTTIIIITYYLIRTKK